MFSILHAERLKQEGNALFHGFNLSYPSYSWIPSEYQYEQAANKYTQAIDILERLDAPSYEQAVLYCNRSFVYSRLENYQKAYEDANHAVSLEPDYVKVFSFLFSRTHP